MIPKELEPLAKEAKKYTTADEFAEDMFLFGYIKQSPMYDHYKSLADISKSDINIYKKQLKKDIKKYGIEDVGRQIRNYSHFYKTEVPDILTRPDQLKDFYVQAIKGQINKSNPSKEKDIEKDLKHPKKVKDLYELENFIGHNIGSRHFDEIYNGYIEDFKLSGYTIRKARKEIEKILIKVWNEPVKEESWFKPKIFKKLLPSYIYLEAIKTVIAEEESKRKFFNSNIEEKEELLNSTIEEKIKKPIVTKESIKSSVTEDEKRLNTSKYIGKRVKIKVKGRKTHKTGILKKIDTWSFYDWGEYIEKKAVFLKQPTKTLIIVLKEIEEIKPYYYK